MEAESSQPSALKRVETGVSGLDTILQGGFVGGGVYIIQGAAGTGKTILANRVAFHQAGKGKKVAYVTLLAESHDRLLRYLSSLGFVDRSLIPTRLFYISAYSELAEGGLPGVVKVIRELVRREHPDLLVLDGLYVAQERDQSPTAFREFIYELQGVAAMGDCTMLFLTNGPNSGFSPEHTMVDGLIELQHELLDIRAVRSLVVHKQRGGPFLEGRHFFRIENQGLVVYPHLEALIDSAPRCAVSLSRLSTGIPDLDRRMHGGVPTKSTTLITGPSGSGKTTFGLAFLAECTPERRGLLFGGYETPEEIVVKAKGVGIDLARLIADGAVELFWHRPVESNLDELAHRLFEAVDRFGAERLFIDGLGVFQQTSVYPERLTNFFTALSLQLRGRGITAFLTAEARKFFHVEDLSLKELSPVAENVVMLRFIEQDSRFVRQLAIVKLRRSGFDPTIVPFEITGEGIALGAPGGKAEHRRADIPPTDRSDELS